MTDKTLLFPYQIARTYKVVWQPESEKVVGEVPSGEFETASVVRLPLSSVLHDLLILMNFRLYATFHPGIDYPGRRGCT